MVQELHALHAAWLGAYTGRSQPSERAFWHELLARTLGGYGSRTGIGCAAGTHRPDQPAALTEAQRAARAAYIDEDVHARARRDSATSPAKH